MFFLDYHCDWFTRKAAEAQITSSGLLVQYLTLSSGSAKEIWPNQNIQIVSDLLKNTGQKIFPNISYHKPSDVGWSEAYVTGAHFDMKTVECLLPSLFR